MRVHQVARRVGCSSKEVRAYVGTLGVVAKSASTNLPPVFASLVVEFMALNICPECKVFLPDGDYQSHKEDGCEGDAPCCIAFVTSRGQDHVPGCK